MNHDIFISYSSKDRPLIDMVSAALKEEGCSVWTDSSIEREWKPEIDDALDSSRLVVVAVTSNSMESAYVTYEWSRAWFKLNRLPYFLYLREASMGMATRLKADFQFHPSQAYLQRDENRLLTSEELSAIVQLITPQLEQLQLFTKSESTLTNAHSSVIEQTTTASSLGNVQPHMREVAGRVLIQGLRHQLTSYGNGEVQVAILRALEKIGETKAIPYIWKLQSHTTDSNVHAALESVARNLLAKVD